MVILTFPWLILAFTATLQPPQIPFLPLPVEEVNGYLSPLYSPHYIVALTIPPAFRLTCYYYRKFYYRKVFAHPWSCSRPEKPGRKYSGEIGLPFVINNVHRYFLYGSIVVLGFLYADAINGMFYPEGVFNFRLGSILLWLNAILLSLYTFSCHSLRHLLGGSLDCYSCLASGKQKFAVYRGISKLNAHHMLWAWMSLIVVLYVPVHITLIAWGIMPDPRLI